MVDVGSCVCGLWWMLVVRSKSWVCSCSVAGALLLNKGWVLGGTGYLGGDIADSGGSGILVVILGVVDSMLVGCGGGLGCWRGVMVGGVCGCCWLLVVCSKN